MKDNNKNPPPPKKRDKFTIVRRKKGKRKKTSAGRTFTVHIQHQFGSYAPLLYQAPRCHHSEPYGLREHAISLREAHWPVSTNVG